MKEDKEQGCELPPEKKPVNGKKKKAFATLQIAFYSRPMEEGAVPPPGWQDWMGDYGLTDKGEFFAPARLCSTKSDKCILEVVKKHKKSAVYHPGHNARLLFIPIDFAIKMASTSGHKFRLKDLKATLERAEAQRKAATTNTDTPEE